MRTRCRLLTLSCVVLMTAAAPGQTPAEKEATVKYLLGLRAPGGGYALSTPRPGETVTPTLRATSGVLRSIAKFGGKSPDAEADAKFVISCFDDRSGGFAETPGGPPSVSATAVGLLALAELKHPDLARLRGPALKYMTAESKTLEDVRIAAAATEALETKLPTASAWLRALFENRRPDGTWGLGPTAPRATGSAAVLTLRLGGPLNKQEEVAKLLRNGQRADGGYGDGNQEGSDLESTYRVMRALVMLKGAPADPQQLRGFIARCRNADGGYGLQPNRPSNASGVYYAGYVLGWLNDLDRTSAKP